MRLFAVFIALVLILNWLPDVAQSAFALLPSVGLGVAVAIVLSSLAYAAGWNARGKSEAAQAKEGIDKKEQAGRI